MCRGQVRHRDVTGRLVGDERVLGGLLALGAGGELGQVPVVVALHFVVEHLALAGRRARDQVLLQHVQDVRADVVQLLLHLAAVVLDHLQLLLGALEEWTRAGINFSDVIIFYA